MKKTMWCVCVAGLLLAVAGLARAEGRWLAPTNGWAHNYVAVAGSGPGSGRPEQFDSRWTRSSYQITNPGAVNYVAITNNPAEGDVLLLEHTNSVTANDRFPLYVMSSGPGAGTTNDLITVDFRFRLVDESQADATSQLHLNVVRPRPDGLTGFANWYVEFRKNAIYRGGALSGTALGTSWHTVRLVIDVARDTGSLYLDRLGMPVATWASDKNATLTRNWISFGDGSTALIGKAQVKYLRWTTNEWVNPVMYLHEGDDDPLTEGFTYKPENLSYEASNNVLPEAASPSWTKAGFQAGAVALTNDEVTGEAALHLDMTSTNASYAYALYTLTKEQGRFTANDLVAADFRFRLVDDSQAEDQAQLQMTLVGPRPDGIGGQQFFYCRFAKDRIYYFNDSTAASAFSTALGTNWHNVNWRVNWNTREADVYLDDSPAPSFSHKSALMITGTNNYTGFGDGSGAIRGIVRVGQLRVTRQTPAWQGGAEPDATPYWQGADNDGSYGYYEGAVPAAVMNHAQGWTASCTLRLPHTSYDAFGVTMRCFDQADKWGMILRTDACYYQNADGGLVQLGVSSRPAQYHTFQMRYDPAGDGGNGAVSYYKNGWLLQTLTRADAYTNGSSTNLFQWGCDNVPAATSTQRWNFVEFAPGNRVIAPVPRDGTVLSVR